MPCTLTRISWKVKFSQHITYNHILWWNILPDAIDCRASRDKSDASTDILDVKFCSTSYDATRIPFHLTISFKMVLKHVKADWCNYSRLDFQYHGVKASGVRMHFIISLSRMRRQILKRCRDTLICTGEPWWTFPPTVKLQTSFRKSCGLRWELNEVYSKRRPSRRILIWVTHSSELNKENDGHA